MSSLPKTFMDSVDEMNEDSCMEEIIKSFQSIDEVEEARDADDQLNKAKDLVKDLNSGYSNSIKLEKKKIKVLLKKLKQIQNGELNPSPSY